MKLSAWVPAVALLPVIVALCGCHSYQIGCTVENRTGATINLLEVDYPSASFGADSLANGADYQYRFQVRGSGPVTVQYNENVNHKLIKITGPSVHEDQEGRLEIVLLPDGKAEFHPELSPKS